MVYEGAITRLVRGDTITSVAPLADVLRVLGQSPEGLKEVVEQLDNMIQAVKQQAIAWQRQQEAAKQPAPVPPPEPFQERLSRTEGGG